MIHPVHSSIHPFIHSFFCLITSDILRVAQNRPTFSVAISFEQYKYHPHGRRDVSKCNLGYKRTFVSH